jgi:N-methylhydantoinase B
MDSVEVHEQKYPIHVDERRLIADSEGAGRHRGARCKVPYGPVDRPMTAEYSVEAHYNHRGASAAGSTASRRTGGSLTRTAKASR